MRASYSVKAIKGAILGAVTTGGWLLADLFLPEPWGDFLLFAAMAVVNVMAGWWIGVLSEKRERAESGSWNSRELVTPDSQTIDARESRRYDSDSEG